MRALLELLTICCLSISGVAYGQDDAEFSCPAGQADVMKYFVMDQSKRADQFMAGTKNSIYSEVFPDQDFADKGYWFWLKSPSAHGFDVKSFNKRRIYMRATELIWTDNTTFKRFVNDLPIAERCVPEGQPGGEIRVADTRYRYYSSCKPYKSSALGTAVNDLDAPVLMDVGGNIGQAWTRVLHYHYNCDGNFQNCSDEEQFFLANGLGLWQWKHYQYGSLMKSTLMNELETGTASGQLPCEESYK